MANNCFLCFPNFAGYQRLLKNSTFTGMKNILFLSTVVFHIGLSYSYSFIRSLVLLLWYRFYIVFYRAVYVYAVPPIRQPMFSLVHIGRSYFAQTNLHRQPNVDETN